MIPPTREREESEAEKAATKRGRRLWEVDAARGVAIVMMAVYHLAYDLETFGGYAVEATTGFWALFADATASAFLLLVGVSLAVSHSRAAGRDPFATYLRRGLKVFAYGMALTAVFWIFGMGTVAFGILHLIGVSVLLAYPFLNGRVSNLLLGVAVFAVGLYVRAQDFSAESPWLLPFGVVPDGLFMPDYRPLLPWFGVVLVGLCAGNLIYGRGGRPAIFAREAPLLARPLLPLGRNSLLIYLVHQPVLLALLAAFGVVELGLF